MPHLARPATPRRARRTGGALAATLAVAVLAAPANGVAVSSTAAATEPAVAITPRAEMPMPTGETAYRFGETLAGLSGSRLETTFMGEIISHHRAAIAMARMVRAGGTDPDIRTHASNIIASQRHQVRQFTGWLEQWYGVTPKQAMRQASPEAQREMSVMEKEASTMVDELRAVPAGAQLDTEFVKRMIAHHTSGIIEFLEVQARAVHAPLRVAATTGITQQQSEIADFSKWLANR